MTRSKSKTPVVFVSSTAEDLKAHREQVRDAVLALGLQPRMQEYFPASGDYPPYQKCMQVVDGADLVVAIIAHRYGWIPPDQPGNDDKSITWLECLQGSDGGKEVLAFVVDETHAWPIELKEEYAINEAIQNGKASAELLAEVQNRVNRLKEFKAWINSEGVRARFTTPESLRSKVSEALHHWIKRHRGGAESETISGDPGKYLAQLREWVAYIDIRGLQVGSGKPHRFPIDQLYIPLTTPHAPSDGAKSSYYGEQKAGATGWELQREHVALQEALSERLLVIIGDPGSGKTTFLKRTAFSLLQSWSGENPDAVKKNLRLDETLFPLMISVAELADFIGAEDGNKYSPQPANWLAAYLEKAGGGEHFGLSEDWFMDRLNNGQCLVMLDGLDEASGRVERETMSALIARLAEVFDHCRFVVTTRPVAYVGEVILPGFSEVRIAELPDEAVEEFLLHWCEAIHFDAPTQAKAHRQELFDALRGQVEIRRLARNPVMLTALAVIHWNEKRIPEQRAELYESIITWLARARERRQGRLAAERCIEVLQQLALAMQSDPNGRQIQVERRIATETVADELAVVSGADENEDTRRKLARAETFLAEEELDSGIVVKRGNHIRFWHLTFQEYLAARAIAGRGEEEQKKILWQAPSPVYAPEWREVILLLLGILHQQGRSKVDGMIRAFMDDLGERPTLADRARCVGLLGAVLRDLSPFAYYPVDARYRQALEAVMAIFEAEPSAVIPFEDRLAAADALGQAGDPRLSNNNPDLWVKIPKGESLLGAQSKNPNKAAYDKDALEDEAPVKKVFLDAFRIGRYLVTVGAYQRFVEQGGYGNPEYWREDVFSQFQEPAHWEDQLPYPNRPVVGVSWFEAQAFCAWAGGRLPREAEWERAAWANDGRKYPWGNEDADQSRLNFDRNVGHVTPVGLYPLGASPEGLQDMAGNVWEWCHDWFDGRYYKDWPDTNPLGPVKGEIRVMRGGSCIDATWLASCAHRNGFYSDCRRHNFGFRMVL